MSDPPGLGGRRPGAPRRGPRRRGGSLTAPVLLVVAYSLLVVSWVFANPPHAAPDEVAHFLRAVSIGDGELVGRPGGRAGAIALIGTPPPAHPDELYREYFAWVEQNTRRVRIPAGRAPAWNRCRADGSERLGQVSGRVADTRHAHRAIHRHRDVPTPPLPLARGRRPAAARPCRGESPDASREGAPCCVGLLALAIALLRAPPLGSLAYAGLVVALTPMTLFLMASLNPSGVEIIASVAFISSLLRLARDAPEPARWIWAAMGVSGFVLALSRTPGPSWIVISAALFLLLVGIRGPGTSSAAICPRRPRRCSPSRSACC